MSSKAAYAALCACRLLMALLAGGYLHPDEFFQSAEVLAGDVLGLQGVTRPWEFNASDPNRSVVPPFLLCGVPFLLLRMLSLHDRPALLRVAPRLCTAALSFLVDWALFSLLSSSPSKRRRVWPTMCLFASSWTVLLFHTRPFSNTSESIVLALAFAATLLRHRSTVAVRYACFAGLCALGFFVRFTFPIFAFPLGVHLLAQLPWLDARRRRRRLLLLLWPPLAAAAATALLTCGLIVAADSRYFGRPTVAPVNNLLYNLDAGNLADHGLHPFYLHAAANLPLLFGPLALLGYAACLHTIVAALRRTPPPSSLSCLLVACVLVPLLVLSRAPHQEARFLLPLLLPLVLLFSRHNGQLLDDRRFWAVWLCFNGALLLFYGFVHQAGVVPALAWAHAQAGAEPTVVVFWRTYMPPVHLAAITDALPLHVIDGRSRPIDDLLRQAFADNATARLHVVCPRPVVPDVSVAHSGPVVAFFPHFSGESPPSSLADLHLDVLTIDRSAVVHA